MALPVVVGVRHFQPHEAVSKLRKNEVVQLLVRDFVSSRAALVALAYTDIVAMSSDTSCSHRLCTVTRIICHRYSEHVAASLRNPLSTAVTVMDMVYLITFDPEMVHQFERQLVRRGDSALRIVRYPGLSFVTMTSPTASGSPPSLARPNLRLRTRLPFELPGVRWGLDGGW